ncbi:LysR family transcriptional regulator [Comamonas testosteroni TK102]|uniref:LysR family transcriptional regulator n=1 Tax=Comamonas testosteroni TK102 TaxID=1392005 RepID=A0A076PK31_COMTE|nr:LysR family transcriptional regulator [Comamonas testosteroni]AIJ45036.1 LysR family transcriptional regulator [Comamonas testosteroni TK102]
MASLEISQLRTLIAVSEAGSLTAAAPRLFLSQSAVSEQIKKLEDCVGQQLLLRGKAGVTPTAGGLQLLEHARRITAMADEALLDLRGESLRGRIRLAVTDYFKPGLLARMLKQLAHIHPGVRMEVSVLRSVEVHAAVSSGSSDLGLVMSLDSAQTQLQPMGSSEALVWASAPGWQQAGPLPLPLLVLPQSCALHQLAIRELEKRAIAYEIAHQASGVAGLQSAIAAGLGVACINVSAQAEGVVQVPAGLNLPGLPRVWFGLLPAKGEEPELLGQVRALLLQQWSF